MVMINLSCNRKSFCSDFPTIHKSVHLQYLLHRSILLPHRTLSNESKSPLAMLKVHPLSIPGYSATIANNPDMTHLLGFLMQNSFIRERLACS